MFCTMGNAESFPPPANPQALTLARGLSTNCGQLERGFIMYVIQYLDAALTYDRRRKHAYFMGFYKGKFREYGKKADAMQFCTRAEAEAFLRDVLSDRKDHKVVKTA